MASKKWRSVGVKKAFWHILMNLWGAITGRGEGMLFFWSDASTTQHEYVKMKEQKSQTVRILARRKKGNNGRWIVRKKVGQKNRLCEANTFPPEGRTIILRFYFSRPNHIFELSSSQNIKFHIIVPYVYENIRARICYHCRSIARIIFLRLNNTVMLQCCVKRQRSRRIKADRGFRK